MSINKFITVDKVMKKMGTFPVVDSDTILKETLDLMNFFKLGIACVTDNNGKLLAVFTDGDFRRTLINIQRPMGSIFVEDIMDYATSDFLTVNKKNNICEALNIMESKEIWDLPVVDDDGILIGLLHLHPVIDFLLKESNLL